MIYYKLHNCKFLKADLFGGALFIKMYLNVDLYISIGLLLALAAIFTIGGYFSDFLINLIIS